MPEHPPVRVGFVGAGEFATWSTAPVLARSRGVVLQAVAARDRGRAEALSPVRAYDDYAAVLDDPDVDLVYISLSNDLHVPWTTAALEAGKHVLCEKPLALTAAEAATVVELAARQDRLLMEAFWYRWHPRQRELERLVRDGALGDVQAVECGFVFDRDLSGNFRLDPARGGGAAYDVGCYAVSAAVAVLGDAEPVAVHDVVLRGPSGPVGPDEVDLRSEATLEWAGGVRARVVGGMDGPDGRWLTVHGSDAIVTLVPPAFSEAPEPEPGTVLEVLRADGEVDVTVVAPADPRRAMVEEVAAAVRSWDSDVRVELPVTPRHSLAVARGLDLILGR